MHQDQTHTTCLRAPAAPAPIDTKIIAIIASLVELHLVPLKANSTGKNNQRHYSWFHQFK